MNDNKTLLPPVVDRPNPCGPDLDDLIFQEESWRISER